MANKTIYFDYDASLRIDSGGWESPEKIRLAYQEYGTWEIKINHNDAGSLTAINVSDADSWCAAIDCDFEADYIDGELVGALSGAITEINIDSVPGTIPSAGVIHLTNSSDQSESCAYVSAVDGGGGAWTLTVDTTLAYVYADGDAIQLEDTAPMVRVQDASIDSSDAANGNISVPVDADTATYLNAVSGEEKINAYFELCGKNAAGKTIYYCRFDIIALNILDPGGGVPPAPIGNYYTEAEIDALLAAKADKVGSDDIEITDSSKGIILTSADSSRWRLTVDNDGILNINEVV